jgi:hypothetical protein
MKRKTNFLIIAFAALAIAGSAIVTFYIKGADEAIYIFVCELAFFILGMLAGVLT